MLEDAKNLSMFFVLFPARLLYLLNTFKRTTAGRPGGSVVNLETFWGWDVSSNLGAVTRIGISPHIMPNNWRTISFVGTQNSISRSTRERDG